MGLLLVMSCAQAVAQDTLRIATYNLLNYPGSDAAIRNPYFRTVVHTINPDVLIVQEMLSQTGVTGFLSNVMNAYQPGKYTSVPFDDGPDTDNSFYYNSSKVVYHGATYIGTALRRIAEYRFAPVGSVDTIRIYSLHLKANPEDSLVRLGEATILRDHLNSLPSGAKFIVGGDFNIYRSSEPAFLKLIGSDANDNGRCKDPLNSVGNWNNNFSFRFIHTQSPRVRGFGGGATGGMDDRFDMLLTSYSMDGVIHVPSYTSYGNDSNHFNDSINRLPNSAVPDSVANALHYAADHLPVFADFIFPQTAVIDMQLASKWNLLSLPVVPNDARKTSLFPTAISNAFYFGQFGYTVEDTLKNGTGYWVKFDTAQTVTIAGAVLESDTISVGSG